MNLLERQAEMQNTSVKLEAPDKELSARFDAQQLTQALVNLLLNAIEASPEGGAVHVGAFTKAGKVEVEVRDDGPGLDLDSRNACSNRFTPRNHPELVWD